MYNINITNGLIQSVPKCHRASFRHNMVEAFHCFHPLRFRILAVVRVFSVDYDGVSRPRS